MPLNEDSYLNLSDDEVEHIDQFLFRFAKLQDTIGEKLFKLILLALDEKVDNKPFIDILNKLEKLELIDSADKWRELRDIRNELAHSYDDEAEEMASNINKIGYVTVKCGILKKSTFSIIYECDKSYSK